MAAGISDKCRTLKTALVKSFGIFVVQQQKLRFHRKLPRQVDSLKLEFPADCLASRGVMFPSAL